MPSKDLEKERLEALKTSFEAFEGIGKQVWA